jgi:DHA2 family multidrug resistance protein
MLYGQMQRQASMLSFVDNFWLMGVICLAVIPLMFVMKKIRPQKGKDGVPMH